MRTWRVGTISMGASLLFLGVYLFISQIAGWDHINVLISWWPIILIVLGIEILLFLFFAKQEKSVLKYDFLSIFFVGILGTVGIIFAVLNTTGLLDLVENKLGEEERTFDLPVYDKVISDSVKRVVLDVNYYSVTVEGTEQSELSLFGTYSATVSEEKPLVVEASDYVAVQEKGDTLYVQLKGLPQDASGFGHSYHTVDATVLVPNDVKLEITGSDTSITMKPRELKSNWMIERASDVSLILEENSDVKVSMKNVEYFTNVNEETTSISTDMEEVEEQPKKIDDFTLGNGTFAIQIMRAHQVRMQTIQ